MLERFEGPEGRTRLVEAFADQELALHSDALAQQLAQVADLTKYKKRQLLYLEGRPGNNKLYFVLTGSFDLLIKGTPVRVISSGQALGEFPILDRSLSYTVTIRAREPSIVATVDEHNVLSIAKQHPNIWKNMARVLVKRLHATYERVPALREPCVFIGHGHSPLWARVQLFLQNDCRLHVVTFETEPHAGESIVPVLEQMLSKATFAVLVLTSEDQTSDGGTRARQNVVHEAGLFQGVLGFHRAILLVQKGLEEFSNVHGLQHIGFEGDSIESSFLELQRVLKREKQIL
jgi:predicted nucleotide-binding protein